MTVKCKATPMRRKSRINPKVIANIIHISPERRKEAVRDKWNLALKYYLSSLDGYEYDIAKHVLMFVMQRPAIVDKSYSCEVICLPKKQQQIGV